MAQSEIYNARVLPIRLKHQSSCVVYSPLFNFVAPSPVECNEDSSLSSSIILLSERTEEKREKQARVEDEPSLFVEVDLGERLVEERLEEVLTKVYAKEVSNHQLVVHENFEEIMESEASCEVSCEVNEGKREEEECKDTDEDKVVEVDFEIETFDPLKEEDQIQVHYLIFNFSYWLHSLGDGRMVTYSQFQKLQRYVTILTEIKTEILHCVTENIESSDVIKPLLELNDSVEEILSIYRTKRPESASLNFSSSTSIANYISTSRKLLPNVSTSSSSKLTTQVCPICYLDVDLGEFIFLHCGHAICKTCAVSYFTLNIEEGKVSKLTCPGGADCDELANEHDVMKAVPHLVDKFRLFSHYNKVKADPNARWCPKPGCGGVAYGSAENQKLECDKCNNNFCFMCNYDWHEGISCKKNERILRKKGLIDGKSESWKKKHNTKPCPSCGASIKKHHGCNHMTCSACTHEFCWVCMNSFTWDHFSNGKCNMFSLKHRIVNGAAEIGIISIWGIAYGVGFGVAIPIMIAGAPVYGIYKLGKRLAR